MTSSVNQSQISGISNIQIELNEHQSEMKVKHLESVKEGLKKKVCDSQYKQLQSYKEFNQRDKIEHADKLQLFSCNTNLLKKDPGVERKDYYLSIIGKTLVEECTTSFKHHYKNKEYIDQKLFELQLAYMDLAHLQQEHNDNNGKHLANCLDVVKCLIRDNWYQRYSVTWGTLVYHFMKHFQQDQLFVFTLVTYFIHHVYPTDYFNFQYRFGVRQVYFRTFCNLMQHSHSVFHQFFIRKQIRRQEMVENDEALVNNFEKVAEDLLERCFYYPKQNINKWLRIIDYLMLFRTDLLLKLQYLCYYNLANNILSQVKNYLPSKHSNIQDILFANQQLNLNYKSIDLLGIVQDTVLGLSTNKPLKLYEQHVLQALETSFNQEFTTTYYIKNERIAQIRRVMAIMNMQKTEVTEQKLDFLFSTLDKSKKVMFSFPSLVKLFNCSSKLSAVQEDFLKAIVSLSTTDGSHFQLIELKFILVLVSKMSTEQKFVKLLLLFLLQEEYTKGEIEYQLCRFEYYLDERLGLFNHGSTLMHIIETEKVEKKKLINMILKGEHSEYLSKYLERLTNDSVLVDEQCILVHCREHEDYLNEKEVEKQLAIRTQQQQRQDIIQQRKQQELARREQKQDEVQFINVIAEDEQEDAEETNIDGININEINQYWDNQYEQFLKKQQQKEKAETEQSLHNISIGNMNIDGIKNMNKHLQYANDSLLTIAEDQNEKFTTDYFQDLAQQKLIDPLNNIKGWFNFSQMTLLTVMEEQPIPSTQTTRQLQLSTQYDLQLLQAAAERHLDDTLLRQQVARQYLSNAYTQVYIGAMVEVVEKKVQDSLRKSVQISNCYEELDVMLNGPIDQRNKDLSMQVIFEDLLEEDQVEQKRIELEVEKRYNVLKQKQQKMQEQNIIIFQSKIKEVQDKYKKRDDIRVTQLQNRVTMKLKSEMNKMQEQVQLHIDEKKEKEEKIASLQSRLEQIKEEKAAQIAVQEQQQEQLLQQQQQQDQLLQENIRQEAILHEKTIREQQLEDQLKNEQMLNLQKQEELEQLLTKQKEKSIIISQTGKITSEEEEEEESSEEEETIVQKTQRNCSTGFGFIVATISGWLTPPPKKDRKKRNRSDNKSNRSYSDTNSQLSRSQSQISQKNKSKKQKQEQIADTKKNSKNNTKQNKKSFASESEQSFVKSQSSINPKKQNTKKRNK